MSIMFYCLEESRISFIQYICNLIQRFYCWLVTVSFYSIHLSMYHNRYLQI